MNKGGWESRMIERVVCRVFLSVVSGNRNHEEFNASSVYREKELHCEHENFEKKFLEQFQISDLLKIKKICVDVN